MSPHPPALRSLGLALLGAGCTSYAVHDADREVAEILEEVEREHVAGAQAVRVLPVTLPEPTSPETSPASRPEAGAEVAPSAGGEAKEGEGPLRLDVAEAIRLAVRQSRDYRSQKESLFLQALSLSGTRRQFSPRFTGVLSYLYAQGFTFPGGVLSHHESGAATHSGSGSLGVSQILPPGGTLSLTATENASRDRAAADPSFDASLTARYSQSLLRGVGYEASHDALIQAERSMVYAARDFELFREDFTIDVAHRFYDLVAQQRVIENTRVRRQSAARTLAQSEALHRVGQLNRVDLYRAQQDDLTAQNELLQAEQSFQDALDGFKVFLGLPAEARLEIHPEEPPFVPVRLTLVSAIAAAEANRLDFKTSEDQLEDARRATRIAAQGLRPDLDFDLTGSLGAPSTPIVEDQRFSDGSLTAGLSLGLPLDRKAERNAYRSSLISLDRAKRSHDLARDNLALEVRRTLRDLERVRASLDIRRQTIEAEERRVRIATIQFRAGTLPNRDVVEAERGLLDARNGEIEERVRYAIARLRLLRILGTLVVDPEGLWVDEN